MRNLHILPNTEVPIELRLEVYKEALRNIKRWNSPRNKYLLDEPYLCCFLLAVLYGSKKVLHKHPETNENLFFRDTKIMFPELVGFLKEGWLGNYTNKERIEFLEQTIKQLSNV